MKKIVAFLLTAVMLLSMTACGGGSDNTPPDNTDKPGTSTPAPTPGTGEKEGGGKAPAGENSIVMWYGANYYGVHEATFYCPEGAYIDEDDLEDYKENGSVSSFNVYDEVREYTATGESHWSRELSNDEPAVYEVLPQLYFYGELDEKNAEEYPTSSYDVTDLGFQWDGKDMMLIEASYTSASDFEYHDVFVGVECEELYWRTKEDGGVEENLVAPMLVGFEIYSPGVELTVDQYAWIAGQLFGVDSGRTWVLEGEEETETPVVNVDASELMGTWLQRDSDWDDTFIFNANGTGMLISGPEYPFTYAVKGDILTLTYDDGEEEEFTISVDGDLLTMIDKWGDELLLDKEAAEVPEPGNEQTETPEPAAPTLKELIIGTWEDQETEYKETFTFNKDGTGKYSFEDDGHWEYTFTYTWYDGDYLEFIYDDDGSEGGFTVRIEGDVMYLSNLSVVDMPLVRK